MKQRFEQRGAVHRLRQLGQGREGEDVGVEQEEALEGTAERGELAEAARREVEEMKRRLRPVLPDAAQPEPAAPAAAPSVAT